MERIFASGMREYQKLRERRISDAGTLLDGARRAMRASFQREMDVAEAQLSFLASVGSVSPYVRFIWNCLGHHAMPSQAWPACNKSTLATVAPGIAEALVATAIGLFSSHPCCGGLQPICRATSIALPSSWKPSLKSSPIFCKEVWVARLVRAARRAHLLLLVTDLQGAPTCHAVSSRGRGRRTINEINMVPFIDVMLVLLIIFMVTAPMITPSMVRFAQRGQSRQAA
jgi:hypothetical protein